MPARRNRNSTLRCDADQIEREAKRLVDTYSDLILRLCYSALGSADDAQDICQDTLIKILQRTQPFDSLEHERAWVIRVALNACRDIGRTHANHPVVDLDSLPRFLRTRNTYRARIRATRLRHSFRCHGPASSTAHRHLFALLRRHEHQGNRRRRSRDASCNRPAP